MIHPTRTNLLFLRKKVLSVINSIDILKARRQALIREFLNTARPLLKSREDIRDAYGKAIEELRFSIGIEGRDFIESLVAISRRDMRIDIKKRDIWGLRYKEVTYRESPVRMPDERGYDMSNTTAHLEEAIYHFEFIVQALLDVAAYENKLKRLSREIMRVTRRIRVLEDRIEPELRKKIRFITEYISEREREEYCRLKKSVDKR